KKRRHEEPTKKTSRVSLTKILLRVLRGFVAKNVARGNIVAESSGSIRLEERKDALRDCRIPWQQLRRGRVSRRARRVRPRRGIPLAQGRGSEGRGRHHPAGRLCPRRLSADRCDGALLPDHEPGACVCRAR